MASTMALAASQTPLPLKRDMGPPLSWGSSEDNNMRGRGSRCGPSYDNPARRRDAGQQTTCRAKGKGVAPLSSTVTWLALPLVATAASVSSVPAVSVFLVAVNEHLLTSLLNVTVNVFVPAA